MMRRRPIFKPRDTTMLSGWLFADLLLGLAVIFLMAIPGGKITVTPPTPIPLPTSTATRTPIPTPTITVDPESLITRVPTNTSTSVPTRTPTSTPTATDTPIPTDTPTPIPIITLSNEPEVFFFSSNPALLLSTNATTKQAERDRLKVEILNQIPPRVDNKRAGFVLTFGNSLNESEALLLSREFNSILRETLPEVFDRGGVLRDYIDIGGKQPRGTIEVQVFLFVESR